MYTSVKSSRLVAAVCILCLLVLAPTAQAADTSADAVADESPHAIDSVNLRDDTGNALAPPVALNPQGSYSLEVTVTDNNLLADIDSIKAVLYYNSDGTASVPTHGNASTAAILTWDRDAPSPFALDAGSSVTWQLNEAGCTVPPHDATTGTWTFSFTVGDITHETETPTDRWQLEVQVLDAEVPSPVTEDTFNAGQNTIEVNHYSRLEGVTTGVSLGHAGPGKVLPNEPVIDLVAISNGRYLIEAGVSETWTGVAGNMLTTTSSLNSAQQIGIMAKGGADLSLDTSRYGNLTLQHLLPVPAPLKGLTDVTGPTDEGGDLRQVKVFARFSDFIREDTYQGVIYLTIGDSSGDE